MQNIDFIISNGKKAQGKKEYIDYAVNNIKLSPSKAIIANCYFCMNFYLDGRNDCEIDDCPLYPFMPYRKGKVKVKRVMSEKQKEAFKKMTVIYSGSRKNAKGKLASMDSNTKRLDDKGGL